MALRLNEDASAPRDDSSGKPKFAAEEARLKLALLDGSQAERKRALTRLIELGAESALVEVLQSGNLFAAQLATAGLWECWLNEFGPDAREAMDKGVQCMNGGELTDALAVFQALAAKHPDWAEAQNKQATVFYLMGNARHSLRLCQAVVKLKPHHFGAWNGMALCAAQLEKWKVALDAARKALSLQPTALANHDLIQLAESKLREED